MNTTIISVTEKGRLLSQRIAGICENAVRCCHTHHTDETAQAFDDMSSLVRKIFNEYDCIIFVCAAGIAVRMIAPLLRSKCSDPAVIVTDDCGKFVIPILSGHIGGANSIAVYIAKKIGAVPVITTATDTGGHFSPDSMAAANSLIIGDMHAAKLIASAVLDGKKIGLVSKYPCINIPPEITENETEIGLCISDSGTDKPFPVTLDLVPKNIIVGMGCKKGVTADAVAECVRNALGGISEKRIAAVATADIKAEEAGLLEYCRRIGAKLHIFTADELMQTQGEFTSSEFVRSVTGADNICERSAAACGGKIIVKKTALNGVTAAVAKKDITIDFAGTII